METSVKSLRVNRFFKIDGQNCQFLGLITAPANAGRDLKQEIYDNCIKSHYSDRKFLAERNLLYEELNVFVIYLQNGMELVRPLSVYLDASNSAS